MLNDYFIEKLIGLQDVEIKEIENDGKNLSITLRIHRKPHKCPCCGKITDKIHDYRKQVIRDAPTFGIDTTLILEKRRYVCECGKRFFEKNEFLPRYHRMTLRLIMYVLDQLKSTNSFTDVARRSKLSVPTVIRIFDSVGIKKFKLPTVIAIDEFKGNTGGNKYNCIITDPVSHKVLDILPSRSNRDLSSYFKGLANRESVSIFISDMWKPYSDIASTYFKNAMQVVDKYHWIRQSYWALERIRKDFQKKLMPNERKYFKRSRKLLLKPFNSLREYEKEEVEVMLSFSYQLRYAHELKERFIRIIRSTDRDTAKDLMLDWIDRANESGLKPFNGCANTMFNWFTSILNSFSTEYTNGFTEGCNNKIKVLKRNAYGYRNFERFRKRILYVFG